MVVRMVVVRVGIVGVVVRASAPDAVFSVHVVVRYKARHVTSRLASIDVEWVAARASGGWQQQLDVRVV